MGQLKSYYIYTSSPDRSGILRNLSRIIALNQGNIAHFRQDTHLQGKTVFGNIHLIVTMNSEKDIVPGEEAETLKMNIERTFVEDLYKYKNEDDRKNITVKVEPRDNSNKILARFKINFFDERGIAEKIFEIFSERDLSVVESFYRLNSDAYENRLIGRIVLYADITEAQVELEIIADKIRKIRGIFNVTSSSIDGDYSL